MGDVIAVVYSVKDGGVGASGSPSLAHVNQGWKLLEEEFQEEDGLWSRWKDNIIFVHANRRPGKFGVRINSQSRKEDDAGRAAGRQSVLLSNVGLSGWLPGFMPTFLNASQYLQQAGVAEKTLSCLVEGLRMKASHSRRRAPVATRAFGGGGGGTPFVFYRGRRRT